MYFPNNTPIRQAANAALHELGLADGYAKIREHRGIGRPAWDILHKPLNSKRGKVVFTVIA